MQVTSKLVKAAEALLRGALEPLTMFALAEGQHMTVASQASPCKEIACVSDACLKASCTDCKITGHGAGSRVYGERCACPAPPCLLPVVQAHTICH